MEITSSLRMVLDCFPELTGWSVSRFDDHSYKVTFVGQEGAKARSWSIEVSHSSEYLDQAVSGAAFLAMEAVMQWRKTEAQSIPQGPPRMDSFDEHSTRERAVR